MASSHAPGRIGAILLATPGDTAPGVDLLRSLAAERPLAAWALAALVAAPRIGEIALVVESVRVEEARALVASVGGAEARVVGVEGAEVGAAIGAGLGALSARTRVVVLLEAPRPLVTAEVIEAGIDALGGGRGYAAACATAPVKETVKRAREGLVVETLDRSRLALMGTPMIFEREALDAALRSVAAGSRLAGLLDGLRAAGRSIALYPGGAESLSVVTGDDLALADRMLRGR